MLYVIGQELRNQLSGSQSGYIYAFFIFIYNARSDVLYEKELDEIRNWPSVLETLSPSSWKAISSCDILRRIYEPVVYLPHHFARFSFFFSPFLRFLKFNVCDVYSLFPWELLSLVFFINNILNVFKFIFSYLIINDRLQLFIKK